MQHFFIIICFSSIIFIIHSYLLYPIIIWFVNLFFKIEYLKISPYSSPVSIIISVYNEEKVIEKTIRNVLKSNYDLDKIEFIIGSDNSTDLTNKVIDNLSKEIPNLKFFPFQVRRGKSQVLNDLVKHASSDILIFADGNTIYHKDAIRNMVKYYVDPNVGGVSGKLILLEFEGSINAGSQEKKYWDLESWLKEQEGNLGMLIGANGGIYSIRKELFIPMPSEYPVMDDFYITLKVLEQKKYFIYAKDALAEEYTAPSIKSEFNRKIRNNSINISTLKAIKKLLSPSYKLVSFGLWSHKIIRWNTPILLILLFFSNLFLLGINQFFFWTFVLQLGFYISAILGFLLKKINIRITFFLLCFYFIITNIAMLIGIYKYIFNKQTAFWQSTARN